MSFEYNSSGLRTQKTVDGETKQYFYSGDLLVSEYDGLEYMNFTYSPSGELVGFSFTDAESNEPLEYYIYLKNLQGDIIGLIDFKGDIAYTYSYDAWGKLLGIYDEDGDEVDHPNCAAVRNPLRYRGYYYDTESELYYLNSRYYNPEWGRFISADTVEVATASPEEPLYDKSLYAYCDNNPIARIDTSGYFWDTVIDVVSIAGDLASIIANPTNVIGYVELAADVAGLVIPGITGGGKIVRVVINSDDLVKARKVTDKIVDAKKAVKIDKMDGISVHNSYDPIKYHLDPGKKLRNQALSDYGSKLRPDAVDLTNNIIYELKPYNKNSFNRAIKQSGKYASILDKKSTIVIDMYWW